MSAQSLPLTVIFRIDEACDAFEKAWPTSERMALEDMLMAVRPEDHAAWLLPLLQLEVELRRRNGETPQAREYEVRFAAFPEIIHSALLDNCTPRGQADPVTWVPVPTQRTAACPAIDGYEIVREAGRGGMGVVYEARQTALNRRVAIKFIRSMDLASPQERERFLNEARSLAKLQHAGIVSIYDVGEIPSGPFMVMEFLDGGSLASRLNGEPLPPQKAAALLLKTARTIQFAHQSGIVHRDLNPSNILLTSDREPKISDFGLARWFTAGAGSSGSGMIVGTPSYMSPEQARGSVDIGTAADIYGLGAILYEMLTGQPPFRGTSPIQTMQFVQNNSPLEPTAVQPGIPRDLATVCLKCLEKRPERRYPDATELIQDLERFLSGRPVRARPVSSTERLFRWASRNPLTSGLIAMVLLTLVLGLAGTLSQLWRAEKSILETREQRNQARRNYERARELADYLTEVSSRDLADIPAARNTRRRLLTRALEYYSRSGDELTTAESGLANEIPLTLLRLGDLHGALGDQTLAISCYRDAITRLRRLLAGEPDNQRSLRHLAGACQNLAGVLQFFGPDASREALDLLTEADELWKQMIGTDRTDADAIRAWAKCRLSRAVLLADNGKITESDTCARDVISLLSSVAATDPADLESRLIMARSHSLLGNQCESRREYTEGQQHHRYAVAMCRQCLTADSTNKNARAELALCLNNLAVVCRRLEEFDAARAAYQEAIQLTRDLHRADASDPVLLGDLSRTLLNLGILERAQSRWSAAEACFLEAVEAHRQLLERTPENPDHRAKLAFRWTQLAVVQLNAGKAQDAVTSLRQKRKLWPDNAAENYQLAREFAECLKSLAEQPDIADQVAAEVIASLTLASSLEASIARKVLDEPVFDPVRQSDRFRSLLQTLPETAEPSVPREHR